VLPLMVVACSCCKWLTKSDSNVDNSIKLLPFVVFSILYHFVCVYHDILTNS
jgi:hypothetical protein